MEMSRKTVLVISAVMLLFLLCSVLGKIVTQLQSARDMMRLGRDLTASAEEAIGRAHELVGRVMSMMEEELESGGRDLPTGKVGG